MSSLGNINKNGIHYLSWKSNLFSIGHSSGYLIIQVENEKLIEKDKISSKNGFSIVELNPEENMIGLVGNDFKNKLYLWNYESRKSQGEISCNGDILNVRFHNHSVFAATGDSIFIYEEESCKQLHKITCIDNPNGMIHISLKNQKDPYILYPEKGFLHFIKYPESSEIKPIKTHENLLSCIFTIQDWIVTASEKGTLIRIHNMEGDEVHVLRRGSKPATIYSLAVSTDKKRLCCTSDSGTVHIWDLEHLSSSSFSYPKSKWRPQITNEPCCCVLVDHDVYLINTKLQFFILKEKQEYQNNDTNQINL